MNPDVSSRLLFIVDSAGFQNNTHLISAFQARFSSLDEASQADFESASGLVVDVDLTHSASVKLLKSVLKRAPLGQTKVFAVNYGRRLEMIYANIAGATGMLRRPISEQSLRHYLAWGSEDEGPLLNSSEVIDASIASAAGALSNMFEALTSNGRFDLPGLTAAGEEVIEAIAETGFPGWLEVVRHHHAGTFQHCLIVTGVLTTFAQSTGMSRKDISMLTRAGLLHDVGKAAIPIEILDKPGQLTDDEMAVIRTHPGRGFDYLKAQAQVEPDILMAVRGHHEFLDGSGYPDGLLAGAIEDVSRVMTICDIYGALIERRSYKPALSASAAIAVLHEMAESGKVERPLVKALERAMTIAA